MRWLRERRRRALEEPRPEYGPSLPFVCNGCGKSSGDDASGWTWVCPPTQLFCSAECDERWRERPASWSM